MLSSTSKNLICFCQVLGGITIGNAISELFMFLATLQTRSWAAIHARAALFHIHLMNYFTSKNILVYSLTDKEF